MKKKDEVAEKIMNNLTKITIEDLKPLEKILSKEEMKGFFKGSIYKCMLEDNYKEAKGYLEFLEAHEN